MNMTNEVRIFHLLNGEDVIAEVLSKSPNTTELMNPARIIVMPPQRPNEGASVGMAPWLQFSDSTSVTLKNDHIVYDVMPAKQMLANYQQMFSKIVLPKSPSILMPT